MPRLSPAGGNAESHTSVSIMSPGFTSGARRPSSISKVRGLLRSLWFDMEISMKFPTDFQSPRDPERENFLRILIVFWKAWSLRTKYNIITVNCFETKYLHMMGTKKKTLMCASIPISAFAPSFLFAPHLQGKFFQFLYFLDAAVLSQWGKKREDGIFTLGRDKRRATEGKREEGKTKTLLGWWAEQSGLLEVESIREKDFWVLLLSMWGMLRVRQMGRMAI